MDSKSAVCMANNVKYNNNSIPIAMIVHFVGHGENWKMHKIDWCERGMQLTDIATNNAGKHDFTTIMKYIMVRLDN